MSILKETNDIHTLNINYLTQEMYNNVLESGEINDNELYLTPVSGELADTINYITTAPASDNLIGLKIAVLDVEPVTKYNGWIYLIKEN